MSKAGPSYTISTRLWLGHDAAVDAVREALGDQGFGVLTEIDLAATMKAKLGKDLPPQVTLGACRPPLAYEALQADPSVAALLPCNVVVRQLDARTSLVEGFDPEAMLSFSANPALSQVAAEANGDCKPQLTRCMPFTVQGSPPSDRSDHGRTQPR